HFFERSAVFLGIFLPLSNCWPLVFSGGNFGADLTVAFSVKIVDYDANDHPNSQPLPAFNRKRSHQRYTDNHPKDGYYRHERCPERPYGKRTCFSKHDNANANQGEGKQGTDAYHMSQICYKI